MRITLYRVQYHLHVHIADWGTRVSLVCRGFSSLYLSRWLEKLIYAPIIVSEEKAAHNLRGEDCAKNKER